MKVTEVSVTYERKLNTGNYSSATVGIGLWSGVDEGEDPQAVVRSLQVIARDLAKEEAMRLLKPSNCQIPAGGVVGSSTPDPAFQAKVAQAEQGPGIVRPRQQTAPQAVAPPAGFPAGSTSVADLGY